MEDIIFENDLFVIELQKEAVGGEVLGYSMDGSNYEIGDEFSIIIEI